MSFMLHSKKRGPELPPEHRGLVDLRLGPVDAGKPAVHYVLCGFWPLPLGHAGSTVQRSSAALFAGAGAR